MPSQVPSTPNLTVGSKVGGCIVLEVLDAAKGCYVFGKVDVEDVLAKVVTLESTVATQSTQSADISKQANDAAFNAQEALNKAAAAAVEISKIPGLIQDANYNTNSKTSEIKGSVQDLTLKHNDLSAIVALKADKAALAATDSVATALAVRVKAIEDVPSGGAADVTSKNTAVKKWNGSALNQAIIAVNASYGVVGQWNAAASYSRDGMCLRGKTQYTSLTDANINHDPATDTTGQYWSVYRPGEDSDVYFSRPPTSTDIYASGVKWHDTEFGTAATLDFMSKGGGEWVPLQSIRLRAIRLYITGYSSSYTVFNTARILGKNGAQYPAGSWICGASNNVNGGNFTVGAVYSNQSSPPPVNQTCWIELEPSSNFIDNGFSDAIANFRDTTSTGCTKVELHFSNGGIKTFAGKGNTSGSNINVLPSPVSADFQYGQDPISAALGVSLTAAQLSDGFDNTFGRTCGAVNVSAFNRLAAPLLERIAALEAKVANLP